jgi:acyl-CoA synthetase (AMP-forming)/AMP-acid ligase II
MTNESGHFTIKDLLFNRDQDPDLNAIESPGLHPLTYHDLRMQVLYVVKTLNAGGFHRNDRIALVTPAGPETAVIIASVMAGFTAIPLNPQNTKQEYQIFFSQLKIKAIIVQRGHETAATAVAKSQNIPIIELIPLPGKAGKFELEPAVVRVETETEFATPTDISYIILTSGTTARSKIVPVSQKQFFLARQRQMERLKITSADRCLHIVPYYHGMGIGSALLSILLAGGTVICTKDFIPPDFFHLLRTFRPTLFVASPAFHQAILRESKKVPMDELKNTSLRLIVTSSASLPPSICHELETVLGVPVIENFASSEAGSISINFPPKRGSVGMPVVDHLRILDEHGTSLGPYEPGEIVVKGETVFSGYEDAPLENKAAFTEGWFRTGDIGYLDDEGYLFLTGRKKELINKGGRKIAPAEIDAVLISHPGIRDAMTFSVPDPALGEDIAAMVVPDGELVTEAELRIYLLDHLVQYKIPSRIYFVETIPKTPTGKPLRYAGTERYGGAGFRGY